MQVEHMRELQHLSLRRNQLRQLASWLPLPASLVSLELSHNDLQELTSSLCRCANLRRLDLSHNENLQVGPMAD